MTIFRMYSRVLFPGLIISIFNFCTAQSTAISGKTAPMTIAAPIRTISPNADCPLNDNRPAFTWQPGREVPNGSTYALVLVELSEKQDAAKALAANPRLIDLKSIRGNSLSFPRNVKSLVPGRVYAYQVTSEPPKSAPKAKPVQSDIAVFFLQPGLPFDLRSITCCESNLLKDGAAAWTTAYGTPHISPKQAGCFNSGGLIEMSGNRQAGTAVQQALPAAHKIRKGEKYLVSFCVEAFPKQLDYVRLRVLAFNGALPGTGAHPEPGQQIAVIGETGNIADTEWNRYFLASWTAPRDFEKIAVLAVADENAPQGVVASGAVSGICLQMTDDCGFTAADLGITDPDKIPAAVSKLLDPDNKPASLEIGFDQGRMVDLFGQPFDAAGRNNWYQPGEDCLSFGGELPPQAGQDLKKWQDYTFPGGVKPDDLYAAMKIIQEKIGNEIKFPDWKPIPPAKDEECRIPYDKNKPFSGRDIVYVHGFRPDHVYQNIIKSDPTGYLAGAASATGFLDPAALDNALTRRWPDSPGDFFGEGFYKKQGEGYWNEHIRHFLGDVDEPSNRYLVIAYNSSQRLVDNVHSMLTQISLAMNEGTGVVASSKDPRGKACFGRDYVIVIHSTGALVTDAAMAMSALSATDPAIGAFLGDAGYIADRAKAHISLHGAVAGSELAGLAVVGANVAAMGAGGADLAVDVGNAVNANPPAGIQMMKMGLSAFGISTDAIGAFLDAATDDMVTLANTAAAVTNNSILVDLTPPVSKMLWGPLFNQTPVPVLTVAGGHPGGLGISLGTRRILPGLDDGVVCTNSQSGSPSLLYPDPYGYIPPATRIYDLGISAKRALPFYIDQYLTPALAGYGSIPFLAPDGMVQPVAVLPVSAPRYANHFPFLQSTSEHNHPMQPDSVYVSTFGASNTEESLVVENSFLFSQQLVNTGIISSMRQTVRGQDLVVSFRISYPVFNLIPPSYTWRTMRFSVTAPLWRRTYRKLSDGWKETDYVYRFVLR
ncbi:MAG: hypothetical protein H6562_00375 [Lewinellaceae bacterium]|nr:hypothetical protein [Lewinellaceae bacterium]